MHSPWIYNNKLQSLPASLGKLKDLLEIYAWNNSIGTLPVELENLRDVELIDFRQNDITEFPSSFLHKWPKIQYIYLDGNPVCGGIRLSEDKRFLEGTMCIEQCSMDCENRWINNGKCDDNDYTFDDHLQDISRSIVRARQVSPAAGEGCNVHLCENDGEDCT